MYILNRPVNSIVCVRVKCLAERSDYENEDGTALEGIDFVFSSRIKVM